MAVQGDFHRGCARVDKTEVFGRGDRTGEEEEAFFFSKKIYYCYILLLLYLLATV